MLTPPALRADWRPRATVTTPKQQQQQRTHLGEAALLLLLSVARSGEKPLLVSLFFQTNSTNVKKQTNIQQQEHQQERTHLGEAALLLLLSLAPPGEKLFWSLAIAKQTSAEEKNKLNK